MYWAVSSCSRDPCAIASSEMFSTHVGVKRTAGRQKIAVHRDERQIRTDAQK